MNFQHADTLSLAAFTIFSALMFVLILYAHRSAKIPNKYFAIFCAITLIASFLAIVGITPNYVIPIVPILFATFILTAAWFAFGVPGAQIISRFSFATLVGFQSFRLVLELILHHWASIQTIPVTMTWTGQNFDILTGALSIVIAPFANRHRKLVWLFQIIGFALLLNVIRVVVLSSPFPFSWPLENPLQLALYFPYIMIGPLFVWPAIFGHLVLFRKLLKH